MRSCSPVKLLSRRKMNADRFHIGNKVPGRVSRKRRVESRFPLSRAPLTRILFVFFYSVSSSPFSLYT